MDGMTWREGSGMTIIILGFCGFLEEKECELYVDIGKLAILSFIEII